MAFSPRSAAMLAAISGGATEPAGSQPPTAGASGSAAADYSGGVTALPDDGKAREKKRLEKEYKIACVFSGR